MKPRVITIETGIRADIDKVWECWTAPTHVKNWNNASPDWHTPAAENDLQEGGRFQYRMEARDGSAGFDFGGNYTEIREKERIRYTMDDGRKVSVNFRENGNEVTVTEQFEAEDQHADEMQKNGWQAILNNFKAYTENLSH